jgi:hypothetical protein
MAGLTAQSVKLWQQLSRVTLHPKLSSQLLRAHLLNVNELILCPNWSPGKVNLHQEAGCLWLDFPFWHITGSGMLVRPGR